MTYGPLGRPGRRVRDMFDVIPTSDVPVKGTLPLGFQAQVRGPKMSWSETDGFIRWARRRRVGRVVRWAFQRGLWASAGLLLALWLFWSNSPAVLIASWSQGWRPWDQTAPKPVVWVLYQREALRGKGR